MTHPAFIYPQLLHAGDRMALEEFLQRWNHMPELKCAELIDGIVYVPSPVSKEHMRWDARVHSLCGSYALHTPGTEAGANGTWIMPSGAAPQPDFSLYIRPDYGGRSTQQDGLASGAPEFVAEICHSSRAYDLGPKLSLYQSAGVNEYLTVLIEERRFEWRYLVDGSYKFLSPTDGIYRSRILPGLWIDEAAFWNEDSPALLQTLEHGLASQEHGAFVALLAQSHHDPTS